MALLTLGPVSGSRNPSASKLYGAEQVWTGRKVTGKGVKVAVFDSGLRCGHPDFRFLASCTDFTGSGTADDALGHGSFVAGVIAGTFADCPGLAPDAEVHAFRVFDSSQISHTAWFLDAFNEVLHAGDFDILNISIGGPDFRDAPFVEKIRELSASGVLVVSAIGNDGPLFGTLNNPADMPDVLGVGGLTLDGGIAAFSSRGMTGAELPGGYGRVKPDVVAYAQHIVGASRDGGGCKAYSGSSVASPVAAGIVALVMSAAKRAGVAVNPGAVKQVVLETAVRIPAGPGMFEQGAGKISLDASLEAMLAYTPHLSFFPAALDLTDCPYAWPFCSQPIYHTASPLAINVTLINGLCASAAVLPGSPRWEQAPGQPRLEVHFTAPGRLWPWAGPVGLYVTVPAELAGFSGVVRGNVTVTVQCPPDPDLGRLEASRLSASLPVAVSVIPTPERQRRVLWDTLRGLAYPAAFAPRDSLDHGDPLDWNLDHPHTNFRGLYRALRAEGYFVELSLGDLTCVDLSRYGALMIVDPEDEFFPAEIDAVHAAVRRSGLSLVVLADWYSPGMMAHARFRDDNTNLVWTPVTGGANVPALNDLLSRFGGSLGGRVLEGSVAFGADVPVAYASGTSIEAWPKGGVLFRFDLKERTQTGGGPAPRSAVLGLIPAADPASGRVAVYGDTGCADEKGRTTPACYRLVLAMVDYATGRGAPPGDRNALPHFLSSQRYEILSSGPLVAASAAPLRWDPLGQMRQLSRVLGHVPGEDCGPAHRPRPHDVVVPLAPPNATAAAFEYPSHLAFHTADPRPQARYGLPSRLASLYAIVPAAFVIFLFLWRARRTRKDVEAALKRPDPGTPSTPIDPRKLAGITFRPNGSPASASGAAFKI